MRIATCAVSIALAICASRAFANGTLEDPPPSPPTQQQQQQQEATATTEQTQTATGGAGGNGSATADANGTLTSANDYSSRSLSLFNASAIPSVCPPGWVHGRRFKRAWQTPIVGVSAICVRDTQAVADVEAARAHESDMARLRLEELRLLIERDREAARRIEAETSLVTSTAKQ